MEYVSPMKSILQQYQALNTDLQEGLLVIIYRSLPLEQQQSILAQLVKLEIERDQGGPIEYFEPYYIIKILKACHCLKIKDKLNILETFLDSIANDSLVTECIEEDGSNNIEDSGDAPAYEKENTAEPSHTASENLEDIVRTRKQSKLKTENEADRDFDQDLDIKSKTKRNAIKIRRSSETAIKEEGMKTRKRKYTKGSSSNKCELCDYVFANRFSLHRHMAKHEESNSQGVFCNYCKRNNWYKTAEEMVEHQKKCHPYISSCSQCDMSFVTEAALAKHELSHSRPVRYVLCNFCGDAFSQMCNAKNHIKVHHSGEHPYKCRLCAAPYADPAALHHHERHEHPDQKPYSCSLCEESFPSRPERQRHWRLKHDPPTVLVTGENPSVLEEDLDDDEFWAETEKVHPD